jgi:hypothetical protein
MVQEDPSSNPRQISRTALSTGMVIALCGVFRHDVSFPAHDLSAVYRESALRSCEMWT